MKYFEIHASPKNSQFLHIFNPITGKFQKDGDENTSFETRADALGWLDAASRAWRFNDAGEVVNEDVVDVREFEVEEE